MIKSYLLELNDVHREMIFDWRNHESIRKVMFNSNPIPFATHIKWFDAVKKDDKKKFFVAYYGENNPIGLCSFVDIDENSKKAYYGMYASPIAFKGSGAIIQFLALEKFFIEFEFNKIYCDVLSFNIDAMKLHKKFNFKEEGFFREDFFNGHKYIDVIRFSLLKKEWLRSRDKFLKIFNA